MSRLFFIYIILTLVFYTSVKANDDKSISDKKLQQFKIEYWNTHKGLPYNSLLNLYQSKDGYLWISGYQGLIRFDGHKFITFNRSNTSIFKSNIVGKIGEDNLGNLWFTSQESGLIKYSQGEFESFGVDRNLKHLERALLVDKDNKIWSSSPGNGWFYFENNQFTFLEHNLPLQNIEVRDIIQAANGDIIFATLGSGMFIYDGVNLTQYTSEQGLPSNWVYSLHSDSNNKLWIGTGNGLAYFENNKIQSVKSFNNIQINGIISHNSKWLWLGTNSGLYRFNTKNSTSEYLNEDNGLVNNYINDLAIDFEGNIWITHNKGGLTQIIDGKFINYSSKSGLNSKVVNAVCEYKKGEYLLGYDNGKTDLIKNGKVTSIILNEKLEGKRIRHILKDSKNNLWISTYGGLLKIENNGKNLWYTPKNGLKSERIRLTFEDSKGNIWIGTRNHGVFKLNTDGEFENYSTENGLSSFLILSITEKQNSDIYIGTNKGGLNIIHPDNTISHLGHSHGLQSDIVFNTYHDSDGDTWVVLNGGLCFIRNDNIHCFTTDDGLLDNSPFDIVEGLNKDLWLSSPIGIMKINKQSILAYIQNKTDIIDCRLFNHNDGMYENECNANARVIKTLAGTIVFPTIDGIAELNAEQIETQTFIPPVYIENILVDNVNVDKEGLVKYQSGNKRITFKYSAISFGESERIKFKFRLQGYEENWQNAQFDRNVSYTNLSPGYYTFKVIAGNSHNEWNELGDEIDIYIQPRFFERTSFYILLIILVTALSYLVYMLRVRQLKRSKKRLEKIVRKRTKDLHENNIKLQEQTTKTEEKNKELVKSKAEIEKQSEVLNQQRIDLEELNAAKDRMFSIISHDLRSPVGNFKQMLENLVAFPERYDDSRREKIMGLLTQTAKSTFLLLENLLNWSKTQMNNVSYNPEPFSLSSALNETISIAQPIASSKEITIASSITDDVMVFADENMVNTIFRNLINNAIKFTHKAGEINISSEPSGDFIKICVNDNGIGIKKENTNNIFNPNNNLSTLGTSNEKGSGLGLTICHDFVIRNGGKIWIESDFGKGSSFIFTLKKTPS